MSVRSDSGRDGGQRESVQIADQFALLASILGSPTEYAIVAEDFDRTSLTWNEDARRLYGYEAVEVVGKAKTLILYDSDDVKSGFAQTILTEVHQSGLWTGVLKRVRKNGSQFTAHEGHVTNYELTLRAPGGREVLVSFNASVFKDTEGNTRGIFAVARDVTAQRHLEEQLREQQNYTRGLTEASVDALVTVDSRGRITDVNEQIVRLTGFGRRQLVGHPFADFFTTQAE